MSPLPWIVVRRAGEADYPAVAQLLASSADWMHTRGWTAWPRGGFPPERIRPGIEAGEVWLMIHRDRPVGTFTLDQRPEAEFTAPEAAAAGVTDLLPTSWIGHRLAADREHRGAGFGPLFVRWSLDYAARQGGRMLLVNVARRATPLQDWYRGLGFKHLATVTSTRKPDGTPRQSGYLMGRPVVRDLPDSLVELG